MKWDTRVETNQQKFYSTTDDIISGINAIQPYAYCLPRYTKLNGSYINTPNVIPQAKNGYISDSLSSKLGKFDNIPMITITYDRMKTSNGVLFVFNRLSNDYCNKLNIKWYKDDTLVKEQEYTPNDVEYFCNAKIKLFNKLVISFFETNKPYRYVWISSIKNQRLSDAGGLKIVYDDIALGAKEDSHIATKDMREFVNLENLKSQVEYPNYAMCLPRYAKLDGNYSNTPKKLENMGYVSRSISNAVGKFDNPVVISFAFNHNYSSVGLSLRFNDYSLDYCSKLSIKWFRGSTLLKEEIYYPNSYDYFCYGVVDNYNRVEITFLETSKPFRNVFITNVTWGLVRVFKDDEIEDINCLIEIDEISKQISINTMDFTVRDKTGYDFEFQKKQKQTLYFDEAILGIFYLKNGKQLSEDRYSMETHDAVGLLDGTVFMGGVYENIKVNTLISEIMQDENIPFFIDDTFKSISISGYLPICSKRVALQQVAFAIGAIVDTSYDRNLYLYPPRSENSQKIKDDELFTQLAFAHSEVVTGVKLTVHNYVAGNEVAELYKGKVNGAIKVEFGDPAYELSINGGRISSSGHNYANITGNGNEVILYGKKYIHNTTTLIKENEMITHNKNIAEIKNATLVTASNATQVLNRVYENCLRNESISCRLIVDNHELGDYVEVNTFKGLRNGTITKLDFKFSRNEITAEVVIR